MTRDDPTYLLFALPPGGESAHGVSVGEADTLEAAAEALERVLKPGETGVAVRPGQNRPEAAWLRTHGGEMRRCTMSKLVPVPKAESDGYCHDLDAAYEAQYHVTVLQEELPRLRDRIDALRAQADAEDTHPDLAQTYRKDAQDLTALAECAANGHYAAAILIADRLDPAVRDILGRRLQEAIGALATGQTSRRHETVAYSGDAADVLIDVLHDNFSPQAVAVIITYLQPALGRTNNPDINRQLRWLSDRLVDLVGGPDAQNRLMDELRL